MKTLKKISAAVILTCVLGLPGFAGETDTPPCAPPIPGEMNAPPCQGQIAPDPAVPGQMAIAPAFDAADATAFAISLFESLLPLF